MANQSFVLDPFSTKRTENIPSNPNNQVGGPMGFLDEWGEFIGRSGAQAAVEEGGSLLKDAVGDLVTEIAGTHDTPSKAEQEHPKTPIGGQTEINFNDPDKAKYETLLKKIKRMGKVNQEIRVVEERKEIELEVKDEVAGMTEDQLAIEGNYQTSFKLKEALKSIYNKTWIFFNRVFARIAKKQEEDRVSLVEERNQNKAFMGENELLMGGENKHHFTQVAG